MPDFCRMPLLLSDEFPPRQQPSNSFGLLGVAQRQPHDGLNGCGKAIVGGWLSPVFVTAFRVAGADRESVPVALKTRGESFG